MAYPDPLPSSGALSISTIRSWMIAAGELTSGTTTVSLQTLVSSSHLADKTAPYKISDFYDYAEEAPGPFPYSHDPIIIVQPPYNDCTITTTIPMNITSNTSVIGVGTLLRGDRDVAGFLEEQKEVLTDGTKKYTLIKTEAYPGVSVYVYEVTAISSCLQDYYFQNNNYYDSGPKLLHLSIYNVNLMAVTSPLVLTYRIQNTAGSQNLDRTVNVTNGATNGLADYSLAGTVLDGVSSVTITLLSISPPQDSTYIYHA